MKQLPIFYRPRTTPLDSVVQKLDSAIHWINHYPAAQKLGKPIALSAG